MEIPLIVSIKECDVYQEERLVLERISFSLAVGEMVYLVGKSGSGKTSFLKSLYGENTITGSMAQVLDYDLLGLDAKDIPLLRRKIGMVFQDFNLFEKWTVGRNLSYILQATEWRDMEKINRRVEECLDQVGLLDKLEEPVYKLSGGEQQRVAIARAIINQPQLIIADEPTGNLDPDTSDDIFRLLYKVATQNKSSMLIATHDQRILDKFPARVFQCREQKIVEI